MSDIDFSSDLISYHEMVNIISPKFNCTHDEIRYWVKIAHDMTTSKGSFESVVECNNSNALKPYASDFQVGNVHITPPDGFFYPEYYFYKKNFVDIFVPPSFLRFVYRKDLTGKRNWHDMRTGTTDSAVERTLLRANKCGILRMYDRNIDDFTLFASDTRLWCDLYPDDFSDPSTFFLIFDILNIERIFFNKNKKMCLEELIYPNQSSQDSYAESNVIKFKRKEKKSE